MTAVLMFVVAMAIIAGMVWVMMRVERSHRQLIERRREAWGAGGASGWSRAGAAAAAILAAVLAAVMAADCCTAAKRPG